MKKIILATILLGFAVKAYASEVIPPRIVVEWLVKAVQEGKDEVVRAYFKFDKEKHAKLSPLSRDEQIRLLKDIPLDKMEFDKDKYTVDKGKRFVVRLVAPKKLDFQIQNVELKGELGPPWKYDILAITETAQPQAQGDGANRTETPTSPAEYRLVAYRKLLEEDMAPLKALKDGMTSGEVQKLFPIAKAGEDGGAPILAFSSANGRKITIYFHKATDKMSLVNVYLQVRDKPSEVTEETFDKLKVGMTARWAREDVIKLMGLPDHMSAAINDLWQYGMYALRFRAGVLQSVEPPPRPTAQPDRDGR